MTERPALAYWFAAEPKLPHGDNRPVVIGETLTVEGKLKMCENALHWSIDPYDALSYAKGTLLYQVRPEGEFKIDGGKGASRGRTALAVRDATDMLCQFARERALSVAHLWDMPAIVREYLETGDKSKRAAAYDITASIADTYYNGGTVSTYAAAAAAHATTMIDAIATTVHYATVYAAACADRAAAYASRAAAYASRVDARKRFNTRKRFNEMVTELFVVEDGP